MNRNSLFSLAAVACLACAPIALSAQQAPAKKADSGMHMTQAPPATGPVTPINRRMICMVENKAFKQPQKPVKVNGRTYYGCCSMCQHTLQTDASSRYAVDPVSGKKVDKSKAIVGKDAKGSVVYFQNQADYDAYNARQTTSAAHSGL